MSEPRGADSKVYLTRGLHCEDKVAIWEKETSN